MTQTVEYRQMVLRQWVNCEVSLAGKRVVVMRIDLIQVTQEAGLMILSDLHHHHCQQLGSAEPQDVLIEVSAVVNVNEAMFPHRQYHDVLGECDS